ncbi:hypothetical protein AARAC_010594 [Aspergillus arachidicola]|uniref:Uncharacterized protein n=1 Tax=Aspergillus arachidicola TaxID=656916 RepID=A0A2G7GBM4_9EURO|nr:hypothetical protein AARAC_010594 [Aspergillus arachidicola]
MKRNNSLLKFFLLSTDEFVGSFIQSRNGSGAFFISSLAYPGKVIDVQYGYDDNETAIIIYPPKEDDNENQPFFLRSP